MIFTIASSGLVQALLCVEIVLALVVGWRILHHITDNSHIRRVVFHLVLLLSYVLHILFWFSIFYERVIAIGLGCIQLSWSLMYLCVAFVISQWSNALTAGRCNTEQLTRLQKLNVFHLLFALQATDICVMIYNTIDLMAQNLNSISLLHAYLQGHKQHFIMLAVIHILTGVTNIFMMSCVGVQLQSRLRSSDMAMSLKLKSIKLTGMFTIYVVLFLAIHIALIFPLIINGLDKGWHNLELEYVAVIMHFVPMVALGILFLYLMRRTQPRTPARLFLPPPPPPLLESPSNHLRRTCQSIAQLTLEQQGNFFIALDDETASESDFIKTNQNRTQWVAIV